MRPAGIFGIILIAIGIIALAYGGYTSFTTKENVAKLGPIEINKQNTQAVLGECGAEINRRCRFADAAFLISDRDNFHVRGTISVRSSNVR